MGGGSVVVFLVNKMGVVQAKERRATPAASTRTVTAIPSTAATAPFRPPTPPRGAVLVDVELSDSEKRYVDVVADTAATAVVGAALDGVFSSEGDGGVGEDERDLGGYEVEGVGEDEEGRSESSEEGKEPEVEAVSGEKMERKAKVRPFHPRRPGQPDCTFYVQSGYCKFRADCKFNHPPNRRGRKGKFKKQPDALQVAEKANDVSQQSAAQAEYEERDKRTKYPQRPDATDCSFYMKTGACKFGSACKFNHPSERENNKANVERESEPIQDVKDKLKEASSQSFGWKEKNVKEKLKEASLRSFGQTNKDVKEKLKETAPKSFGQKEKDVKEKLKEGSLKSFGQKNKDIKERLKEAAPKSFGLKEKDVKEKLKEALPKSSGQTEKDVKKETSSKRFGPKEKSNTTSGTCNVSKQSNHYRVKEASSVALNFLNLPIRPGAKECSQYMREGSCKFGIDCMYHHPDPTATNVPDLPSQYKGGQSTQQFGFGVSSSPGTAWNASTPYTTDMHLPYGLPPNPEWNEYQVPMLQPEMHTRNPSASPVNYEGNKPNILLHQQERIQYPRRPGQPECHHFKKNGVCKFRSACKFFDPKD